MQIPRAIKCEEGKKKRSSNYSSIHTVHCTFQLDFKNTRCKNLHCIRSQKSPSAFLPVVHTYYVTVCMLWQQVASQICVSRQKKSFGKVACEISSDFFFSVKKHSRGQASRFSYACHRPLLVQVLVWFIRSSVGVLVQAIC